MDSAVIGQSNGTPDCRADDFTWPHREVETPSASASPKGLRNVRAQVTADAYHLRAQKVRTLIKKNLIECADCFRRLTTVITIARTDCF